MGTAKADATDTGAMLGTGETVMDDGMGSGGP